MHTPWRPTRHGGVSVGCSRSPCLGQGDLFADQRHHKRRSAFGYRCHGSRRSFSSVPNDFRCSSSQRLRASARTSLGLVIVPPSVPCEQFCVDFWPLLVQPQSEGDVALGLGGFSADRIRDGSNDVGESGHGVEIPCRLKTGLCISAEFKGDDCSFRPSERLFIRRGRTPFRALQLAKYRSSYRFGCHQTVVALAIGHDVLRVGGGTIAPILKPVVQVLVSSVLYCRAVCLPLQSDQFAELLAVGHADVAFHGTSLSVPWPQGQGTVVCVCVVSR